MADRITKVLIVSCAGPPKGSPESLQVSKYLKYLLKADQLSFSMVTEKLPPGNFGWRTLEDRYALLLSALDQLITVPVYYHRWIYWFLKRSFPGIFYRPDNEALFARSKRKVIRELKDLPQVIYSRSTPISSAVLALKLQQHFKIPWLMHLSDPWIESPHFKVPHRHLDYHRQMEAECFNKAQRISFTSSETIRLYAEKYPQHQHKYLKFPNVYDDESVASGTFKSETKIRLVHTGNFYGIGRRPAPVLKALQELEQNDPRISSRFELIFTGFQDEQALEDFRNLPCQSVKHLGAVSLQQVTDLQRSAHVLLLIDWQLQKDQAVFQLSKTLDYLAARRPILAITTIGSTVYKMVEGNYGRCFEHSDHKGLTMVLNEIISGKFESSFGTLPPLDHQYAASTNALKLSAVLKEMAVQAL